MAKKKKATPPPPKKSTGTPAVVDVQPSACPTCGCTERTKYFGTPSVLEFEGAHNGQAYNRVVRRRTRCANEDCGQVRFDRSFEFWVDDEGPDPDA